MPPSEKPIILLDDLAGARMSVRVFRKGCSAQRVCGAESWIRPSKRAALQRGQIFARSYSLQENFTRIRSDTTGYPDRCYWLESLEMCKDVTNYGNYFLAAFAAAASILVYFFAMEPHQEAMATIVHLAHSIMTKYDGLQHCDYINRTCVENFEEKDALYQERLGELRKIRERRGAIGGGFSSYTSLWNCPASMPKELVGITFDGSKWVCGPRKLKAPCVIYSLGSNQNDMFEQGMRAVSPCEIHTFDPSSDPGHILNFHPFGFARQDSLDGRERSVKSVMRELGHTYIDVFKMDIEGSEHEVLESLDADFPDGWPFGQMQIEFHWINTNDLFDQSMLALERADFRIFQYEPNIGCSSCAEYAFIHPNASLRYGLCK